MRKNLFIFGGGTLATILVAVLFSLPFWTETTWDGNIRMSDDDIQQGVTYTLEVDACPEPACAQPQPVHAGNVRALRNDSVTLSNIPSEQIVGAYYRVRIFEQASGAFLGQSQPGAVADPTPIHWDRIAVLALLPLVAASTYVSLQRFAGRTVETNVERKEAPAKRPAPTNTTPAAVAPTPTPLTGEALMCRIIVFDAASRLPISDARFWSPARNGFLRSDKAGEPGAYILTGLRGDILEVRAPGHASQRVRLESEAAEVGLPVQKTEVRIRVVGGRSGSALPRIPVQVTRGGANIVAGRTDDQGELIVPTKLEAEDLIETVLATEGFVDGRSRFSQSPDGRQVELRVYYAYEPAGQIRARERDIAQRASTFLETCQGRQPLLATWIRRVDESFAELLEDSTGWGPLLLPGPLSPVRWHETLLAERAELIAEGEAMLRDRGILTALANLSGPTAPIDAATAPPLETWVTMPLPGLDANAQETTRKLRDALTRGASLFPPQRMPLLQEWTRIANKGLDKPARDRVARIAQLYRAHEMLEVLRTVVRDPIWVARLRG